MFCTAASAQGSWFLVQYLECYDNRNLDTISSNKLVIYCQCCEEIISVPNRMASLLKEFNVGEAGALG